MRLAAAPFDRCPAERAMAAFGKTLSQNL